MSPEESGFKEKNRQDLLALLKKPEYAPITDDKIEAPKPPEANKSKMREIKSAEDWKRALADAKEQRKPVVVVSGSPDCFHCNKMKKAGTYDELVKKYGDQAIIVYIDPETNKGSKQQMIGEQVAGLLGITSYPTTAVAAVKSDGRGGLTLDQPKLQGGFTEQKQYLEFIKQNIERAKKLMPEERKKPNPRPGPRERDAYVYLDIPDIYESVI